MPEKGLGEKLSRKWGGSDLQGLEAKFKRLNGRISGSQPEVTSDPRNEGGSSVSGGGHSLPVQRPCGGIVCCVRISEEARVAAVRGLRAGMGGGEGRGDGRRVWSFVLGDGSR